AEAERRGVYGERLFFAPKLPGGAGRNEDHLARHRLAGLFLDTLPCNGGGAASDALRTGLPVVPRIGPTLAGRACGRLRPAARLRDRVTGSLAEYETLARKLATEPLLLQEYTARLAAQRDTCPLFDIDQFRRHLEAAYATMRGRYLSGEPPED